MKVSAQIELMDSTMLGEYAALCGWVIARAHAKASGLAQEISDYIGRGEQMADAMVKYSDAYADQVERDYDLFVQACRSGRVEARTDADMAADFRV
jgi:predicted alpha/beta hydrolase